jgi:small-conductance mechanosensitive channel
LILEKFKYSEYGKISHRVITLQQQKKRGENKASIIGRYLGWLAIRVAILVVLFVLLEASLRFGGLAYLGNEETQLLVYNVIQKGLFSLIVWFFLATSKKMIIPATIITVSPALGKIVRDHTTVQKTNRSITQYLTYIVYFITIVALILIWAYSFIGTWIAGVLGTGLVISLTFVLGLFTSSVLGNVLAYTVLGGTNEFKEGDRVQIGDSYGDIVEVGVFFTRIKTIKDEIISIPNLTVMGKEIRNFSALKEVLIYVQVTLGYDVDKDQAQRLLIESALKTKGIVLTPEKQPFVLFRDLGTYTITYEINAYTDEPNRIIQIKSDLINNILTEFKRAGVEILSPTHLALRNSENNVSPMTKYIDSRKSKSSTT